MHVAAPGAEPIVALNALHGGGGARVAALALARSRPDLHLVLPLAGLLQLELRHRLQEDIVLKMFPSHIRKDTTFNKLGCINQAAGSSFLFGIGLPVCDSISYVH